MSGVDLIVDTNILVYLTAGNRNAQKAVHGNNIFISVITEMELLSWPGSSARHKLIKTMISRFKIISLTEAVKEKAIENVGVQKLNFRMPLSRHLPSVSTYRLFPQIMYLRKFAKSSFCLLNFSVTP